MTFPWTSDLFDSVPNNQLHAMADDKKTAKKRYQRAERRYQRLAKSTSDSLKPEEVYPHAHLYQLKKEIEKAHKEFEEEAETYRDLLD